MSDQKYFFTTGEVLGKINFQEQTIQSFVKSFPFAFGEDARKPNRGRRWTGQDIKNLLLIRYLKSKRESKERIEQALRGEWTPESLPWIEIEEALHIATSVTALAAQAQKDAKKMTTANVYYNARLTKQEQQTNELERRIINLERKVKNSAGD